MANIKAQKAQFSTDRSVALNEPSLSKTLSIFSKHSDEFGFIDSFSLVHQYHDEPKLFQYAAKLKPTPELTDGHVVKKKRASGASIDSNELAYIKCLGEAIERQALTVYKERDLITRPYSSLKKKALRPLEVIGLSSEQKEVYELFKYDDDTPFSWSEGTLLNDNSTVLIPTQLIYFNYKVNKNERLIYQPISTGGSGGGNINAALLRGILEVVERDSFAITYLNKLSVPNINPYSIDHPQVKSALRILNRYKLEWIILSITTDLDIPCFASLILDHTGIGPAVLMGMKASLDPVDAIIGSLEEAIRARSWIRQEFDLYFETKYKYLKPEEFSKAEDRGIYWYSKDVKKELTFWMETETKKLPPSQKQQDEATDLRYLVSKLEDKGHLVYYKDITKPTIKFDGYSVVKVVIPSLQPHSLIERHVPLGGDRLKKAPKEMGYDLSPNHVLNTVPSPFI